MTLSNMKMVKAKSRAVSRMRAQTSRGNGAGTASRHIKKGSLDLRDKKDFTSLDIKSVLLPYNEKVVWKKRTSSCRLNGFGNK